jgi:hypothetical protein
MELMMSKWKPGSLPNSIKEYGYNHPIWTDIDLAKFALIAFVAGVIVGVIA